MRGTIGWRRWAVLTLSVCCCLLSVACAENTPQSRGVHPPPDLFAWNYSASVGATTPQEAYARSAQFAPCRQPNDRMTASADQSATWLLSGPSMGVAYLRATCRGAFHGDYLYRSFLVLAKGTFNGRHDSWYIDEFHRRLPFPPPVDPTPTQDLHVPSLTNLFPADTYLDWGPARPYLDWGPAPPPGAPVSLVVRAWVALTPRDYVLGLVKESVTRPQEATTTTVGGLVGWVTEANGMATIVAPRPDGAVFFFAGAGSASEVEALAARALPRAEDALRDPSQVAITPSPGM
jgi:hypothetical protein